MDDFKQGAFFVNLAPLQTTGLIPSTIAGALRFSFSGEAPPEEQLLDYLRNKDVLLAELEELRWGNPNQETDTISTDRTPPLTPQNS